MPIHIIDSRSRTIPNCCVLGLHPSWYHKPFANAQLIGRTFWFVYNNFPCESVLWIAHWSPSNTWELVSNHRWPFYNYPIWHRQVLYLKRGNRLWIWFEWLCHIPSGHHWLLPIAENSFLLPHNVLHCFPRISQQLKSQRELSNIGQSACRRYLGQHKTWRIAVLFDLNFITMWLLQKTVRLHDQNHWLSCSLST